MTSSTLAAALVAAALSAGAAHAVSFDFTFTDSLFGDGDTVGTGVLSFDDPGGTGTFDFFSLTGVSFTADFTTGESFTLADSSTTAGTQIVLSGTDGSRSLVFDGAANIGPPGSALYFREDFPGTDYLSFNMNSVFGGIYYSSSFNGNLYAATERAGSLSPVPLPAGAWLLFSGLAAVAVARRRTA